MTYRKMKKNEWIKVANFLHWFFVTEEKEPKEYETISDDIKNLIYTRIRPPIQPVRVVDLHRHSTRTAPAKFS